jgi:hypothetical protein
MNLYLVREMFILDDVMGARKDRYGDADVRPVQRRA